MWFIVKIKISIIPVKVRSLMISFSSSSLQSSLDSSEIFVFRREIPLIIWKIKPRLFIHTIASNRRNLSEREFCFFIVLFCFWCIDLIMILFYKSNIDYLKVVKLFRLFKYFLRRLSNISSIDCVFTELNTDITHLSFLYSG